MIQPPRMRELRETIAMIGDASEEELSFDAELVGIDSVQRTFHLQVPNAEDIRGGFDDSLQIVEPAHVPRRYAVTVLRRTRVRYALDEDEVRYTLTWLREI